MVGPQDVGGEPPRHNQLLAAYQTLAAYQASATSGESFNLEPLLTDASLTAAIYTAVTEKAKLMGLDFAELFPDSVTAGTAEAKATLLRAMFEQRTAPKQSTLIPHSLALRNARARDDRTDTEIRRDAGRERLISALQSPFSSAVFDNQMEDALTGNLSIDSLAFGDGNDSFMSGNDRFVSRLQEGLKETAYRGALADAGIPMDYFTGPRARAYTIGLANYDPSSDAPFKESAERIASYITHNMFEIARDRQGRVKTFPLDPTDADNVVIARLGQVGASDTAPVVAAADLTTVIPDAAAEIVSLTERTATAARPSRRSAPGRTPAPLSPPKQLRDPAVAPAVTSAAAEAETLGSISGAIGGIIQQLQAALAGQNCTPTEVDPLEKRPPPLTTANVEPDSKNLFI